MAKILTKHAFDDLCECHCGKPLYKITDGSKNISYARCNYTKEEYDIKTKKWVISKKQPCDFLAIYHGERPVIIHKPKPVKMKYVEKYNIEKELTNLFNFLFVSNRTSTLSEIDIIVRTQLLREPRKKFYFPSTTIFPRFSHYETFQEYRDRIFSEKIVDRSTPPPPKVYGHTIFPGHEYLYTIDHSNVKKSKKIKKKKSHFIVENKNLDDLEVIDSEPESESDSETDSDTDSENCESELEPDSDSESIELEEEETEDVFVEDPVEDYDSGGEYDYDD
jgi:hypothetical protein